MGCHPSHWRTHIFQDGQVTTNQNIIPNEPVSHGIIHIKSLSDLTLPRRNGSCKECGVCGHDGFLQEAIVEEIWYEIFKSYQCSLPFVFSGVKHPLFCVMKFPKTKPVTKPCIALIFQPDIMWLLFFFHMNIPFIAHQYLTMHIQFIAHQVDQDPLIYPCIPEGKSHII